MNSTIPSNPSIPNDMDWLKASFLVSDKSFDDIVNTARTYTYADDKFQNTSLGGNYAINIPPQFTHTADPLIKGQADSKNNDADNLGLGIRADDTGMGRYFSEAIDDNKELLHLRFGVSEFNSIAAFLMRSYDNDAGRLARTGQASGGLIDMVSENIGKLAGFVAAIPIATIVTIVRLGNFLGKLFFNTGLYLPNSKFYYIKPTMRLYWKTVNYMANALAVNMAILPGYMWDGKVETGDTGKFSFLTEPGTDKQKSNLTQTDVEELHKALPDIFRKEGGIDVRAVANKAKRLELRRRKAVADKLNEYAETSGTPADRENLLKVLEKIQKEKTSLGVSYDESPQTKPDGEDGWFMRYLRSSFGEIQTVSEENKATALTEEAEAEVRTGKGNSVFSSIMDETKDALNNWLFDDSDNFQDGLAEYMEADLLSGSDWATFMVSGDKTVSESFSNEVGESAISEKINSTSGSIRDTKFNLAGGDIGIPVIQEALGFVLGTAKSAVDSFARWTGIDGFGVLLGGGFIDIPHTWKNTTASLPKIEYTMELRATYGNKISIFTDIYIPLLMILAGSLPLSTGRKSYTSPFLVEAYRKGRSQVRLGIVESVSVNRGTGNASWSVDDLPLAVDVTFSITDLNQILHVPIDDVFGGYDDDSAYTDYMATLGSLGLSDMTLWPKIQARARAKFNYDWSQFLFNNKASISSFLSNMGLPIPCMNVTIKQIVTDLAAMNPNTTMMVNE